jgi:hypothetical protein
MSATKRQMRDSIAPGSTDYGDRGNMESGIARSRQMRRMSPAMSGAMKRPTNQMRSLSPAMSALLKGKGASGTPITQGLSVGPGDGPPVPTNDTADRLRAVAQYARTPVVRNMARRALLRMARQGEI